jgi:hypothetical protein
VGNALLIDAAWRGKLNAKLAVYRESYAAKSYYGDGVLDGTPISAGSYEVIPGSGALTHSHGIAALAIYEFTGYKLGLSASQNQRDKVTLVNDKFPTLDYKSNFVTAFMSAWQGRWGMYAKVSGARFRTENATFTDGYDWLYANNNFDVQQVGGEVSYEFMKATKAVVGFDWRKYHFYESPDANGMCDVNKSHPCYNPKGAKVFAGIRADF